MGGPLVRDFFERRQWPIVLNVLDLVNPDAQAVQLGLDTAEHLCARLALPR